MGTFLISVSEDLKIRMWKLTERTGDLSVVKAWSGHTAPANRLEIYNGFLYTVSLKDPVLRSWNLQTLDEGPTFEGHEGGICDITIAEDTSVAYTASHDKTIQVWDLKSGSSIGILKGHTESVTGVQVSESKIVSSSADKTLRIWDAKTLSCSHVLKGHTSFVFGFQVQGRNIFSYSEDKSVCVWRLKDGELKRQVKVGYRVTSLHVSTKYFVAKSENELTFFTHQGKNVSTCEVNTGKITGAIFYDNDYLFTCGTDRIIRLWQAKKGQQVAIYRGHQDTVNTLVAYEGWLYSGSNDGSISQWTNELFHSDQEGGWI